MTDARTERITERQKELDRLRRQDAEIEGIARHKEQLAASVAELERSMEALSKLPDKSQS